MGKGVAWLVAQWLEYLPCNQETSICSPAAPSPCKRAIWRSENDIHGIIGMLTEFAESLSDFSQLYFTQKLQLRLYTILKPQMSTIMAI